MKSILVHSLQSLIVLFSIVYPGVAQDNVAFLGQIDQPIYHLFCSQDYPLIALSNDTVYKVFGTTMVPVKLSQSLNLTGQEPAAFAREYNQLMVGKEDGGAYIIDFNDQPTATVQEVLAGINLEHLVYDESKTIYYKSTDSLCTYALDFGLTTCEYFDGLLPASVVIGTDSILYADFLTGTKSLDTTEKSYLFSTPGITALIAYNESIYMLADGQICRRLPNGKLVKLGNVPDKHKVASNIFVDAAQQVWVQSSELFFYDLFDKQLNTVTLKSETPLTIYDALAVDDYVAVATSQGLFQFRSTVDQLVHKKETAEIPRLYGNAKESYLLDDHDLYTSGNGLKFKKLSVNTKLEYPIHGNTGWWVNLGGKLIKVGDKTIPPIESPKTKINVIYELADKQLLIGGDQLLQTYHLNDPGSNQVLSQNSVIDIIEYADKLHIVTKQDVYHLIDSTLTKLTGFEGEYLEMVPVIQEAGRMFLFAENRIEVVNQDSIEQTILALDDLNIRKIIDVELVNEKLYILSPQQLTAILIGDLVHGSFHISEKYPVALSERANLSFVSGKLFIESEEHVSFVNPTRFLDHKLVEETSPQFTLEQEGNYLTVYDNSGSLLPSQIRYQLNDGEWRTIRHNQIDLNTLKGSRKAVIIQKMNAYGDWVPRSPEPIFVSSSGGSILKWGILLGILLLILLVFFAIKRRK